MRRLTRSSLILAALVLACTSVTWAAPIIEDQACVDQYWADWENINEATAKKNLDACRARVAAGLPAVPPTNLVAPTNPVTPPQSTNAVTTTAPPELLGEEVTWMRAAEAIYGSILNEAGKDDLNYCMYTKLMALKATKAAAGAPRPTRSEAEALFGGCAGATTAKPEYRANPPDSCPTNGRLEEHLAAERLSNAIFSGESLYLSPEQLVTTVSVQDPLTAKLSEIDVLWGDIVASVSEWCDCGGGNMGNGKKPEKKNNNGHHNNDDDDDDDDDKHDKKNKKDDNDNDDDDDGDRANSPTLVVVSSPNSPPANKPGC